jgi:replicative DNA helicase
MSELHRPSALDCERYVLAGLLSGSDPDVLGGLGVDDFTTSWHQTIYREVLAMIADGTPPDPAMCGQRLYAADKLIDGGLSYLNELSNGMPVAPNVAGYARAVRDCGRRWKVMQGANATMLAAADQTRPLDEALQTYAQMLEANIATEPAKEALTLFEVVDLLGLDRLINGEASNGIIPGFSELAKIMNHWRAGEVTVLAARPGWGKTALGLQIAAQTAKAGAQTLIVSKEMTKAELTRRMLAQESQTNTARWKYNTQEDSRALVTALAKLTDLSLSIADRSGVEMSDLNAVIASIGRNQPVEFLVVDYLQLFNGTGRAANRNDQLGRISREIKTLAQGRNLHVLLLCQLSREAEKVWQQGQMPGLSLLRDSGEIEQNADNVLFIWPDKQQHADAQIDRMLTTIRCDIVVGKQRAGSTGRFSLDFIRHHTRFVERGE